MIRLRNQLGIQAGEPDAGGALAKLAAAYCVMRVNADVTWKLFAELLVNTAPHSTAELNKATRAIGVLLMKHFPVCTPLPPAFTTLKMRDAKYP